MPAIRLVPPILARHTTTSSVSEPDNRKGGIFAGVAVLIIFVVALSVFIKYRAPQVASAARKKAIADQKTWFASTRPVMRRSRIPHVLDAYTRAPHPQAGDHRGESNVSGASQLPALNPAGSSLSVVLGAAYPSGMKSRCDIGMQPLDFGRERDSFHSMTSVSIGVAVPCNIPKDSIAYCCDLPRVALQCAATHPCCRLPQPYSVLVGEEGGMAIPVTIPEVSSLTQVCNGRRTQPDMMIESIFVIGDEEDEE